MDRNEIHNLHRDFINPAYVDLLEVFDYGQFFVSAKGTKLYDDGGRQYTDFLAGYGTHNIGHNHPLVGRALKEAIDSATPSFLNIDAPLQAGLLAKKLNEVSHPELCRVLFASSGGEAVELALKAAFAATKRSHIVACRRGFHGIGIGASSVTDGHAYRKPFGRLLDGVTFVKFNDIADLENACKKKKPAAFIVEPIQIEGGIHIPADSYLKKARKICAANGTLLIVDEIQTGLGRCGKMFASSPADVRPDILLIGKSLSGGMVPAAAALLNAKTYNHALAGPERCYLYHSTYSGGTLAMIAGLETLKIIESEELCHKAAETGRHLAVKLQLLAEKHDIIKDIRVCGLLAGIEFRQPDALILKPLPNIIKDALYAYVISAVLLRDHALVLQPCSLSGNVLRIEPPLSISEDEIDLLIRALDAVLESIPSHVTALKSALKKRILKGKL